MRGRCLTDRPAVVRQKRSPRTRTDSRVVTALEVTLALLDDLHWGSALEKLGWRGEGLLASALNRDSSAGGISVTRQRWRALKPAIVQLNDHTTRHAIDSNHVRSRPISEGNAGLEGTKAPVGTRSRQAVASERETVAIELLRQRVVMLSHEVEFRRGEHDWSEHKIVLLQ